MSKKLRIPKMLRERVRERARGRCEYCLIHERFSPKSYQADHVIAERHGGAAVPENLAWACSACNYFKGSDLGSFDPVTGKFAFVFNPRRQQWRRHFRLDEAKIEPLTAVGRVTVKLLHLNSAERVKEREELVAGGLYPSA